MSADYGQRVATDLAANHEEQQRVRSELERLKEELDRLERDEAVLTQVQAVLGETGSKQRPTRARADRTSAKAGGRRKTAKAAGVPSAPSRGTAAKAKRESGAPTWLDLVTETLTAQGEPRSAAEVTTALQKAHPGRAVKAPVVRNTLEQGVAQGRLERTRQGRSVFYTAITAPVAADAVQGPEGS
ncbi:hypothetical protein [Streptomyces sp. NPDC049916]|uniref:hypothetical protein n=1 Tax=Streptomyces sp. NPDC049916 TaxID=3155156 RepID=UPI0034182DF3